MNELPSANTLFLVYAVFATLGVFIFVGMRMAISAPGRALHAKFKELGTIAGRSKAEIIEAVGPPNGVTQVQDKTLLQWQATGCHMILRFSGEQCEGVVHEVLIN